MTKTRKYGNLDLAKLPKVSLHDHLDGGVRASTILELADSQGIQLSPIVQDGNSIQDADSLARWFTDNASSGSLVEYLKTFDVTTAVMQSEASLFRIAKEFVEDLIDDGVILGEIRWAPEQHVLDGLSLEGAIEAVQAGIDDAVASAKSLGQTVFVGQIVTAMRHRTRSIEVAELAIRYRDAGVVGFDIAGPEIGFPPALFREAFELLAREMFPVTVHAGEADGLGSICSALVDGRASRIGHGVRLIDDIVSTETPEGVEIQVGRIAEWVLDMQIPLEICPSSNLQTGALNTTSPTMSMHPFDELYRLGFAVTVNPDNRLMGGSNCTRELELLVEAFGYNKQDLLTFQVTAAHHSFLPRDQKKLVARQLVEAYSSTPIDSKK